MSNVIDRNELQRRLANPVPSILVEALPEKYYRDWHLPGALHLPHTQVRELAPALLPEKSADIVVYCASATCRNSHIAAGILGQLGYGNVSVYGGGKEDWSGAGLAVEREAVAA